MCGLVGMAGNIMPVHERMMKDLLFFDLIRGSDSTGIAAVAYNTDYVTCYKAAVDGLTFLDLKKTSAIFYGKSRVFIGHNRAATKGRVTTANAHPFQHGHITGAHNGTLQRYHALPKANDFEVDSEALIYAMSILPLKEALEKIKGAYALTWWNGKDNTLNLLRNEERPLHLTYTTKGDVVMWASEAWMLTAAAAHNKVDIKEIVSLPVDTLFTYTLPEKTEGQLEPSKEGLHPPKPPLLQYTPRPYDLDKPVSFKIKYIGAGATVYGEAEGDAMVTVKMKCPDAHTASSWMKAGKGKVITASKLYAFSTSPYGKDDVLHVLPEDCHIEEETQGRKPHKRHIYKECAWCGDYITWRDKKVVVLDGSNAVCGHCAESTDVKQYMRG